VIRLESAKKLLYLSIQKDLKSKMIIIFTVEIGSLCPTHQLATPKVCHKSTIERLLFHYCAK